MERSNDDEKSPSGALKFAVILPEDIAKIFLQECEDEDRDMSDMGRHIIKKYFKEKEQRRDFEEFSRLRKLKSGQIPVYRSTPPDLLQDAEGEK